MHEFLNKYGYYIVGGALLIVGILLWMNLRTPTGVEHPSMAFYIDEETNEETLRSNTEVPPLDGASGKPTLVQAMKFRCKGESGLKTLYLFKYSPEAQEAMRTGVREDPHVNDIITKGQLFRSPAAGSKWYGIDTPEAQALLGTKCADGSDPVPASP